jgi:glycosyltransferase involved in cell wall biosynthesis
MNILILTPQLPYPPHQGTSLRNFHIIKGLAQRHTVTLLTFTHSVDPDFGPLADLCAEIVTIPMPSRTTAERLLQLVTTRQPDMAHRLRDVAFDLALDELLETNHFEIVQIEGIELANAISIVRNVSPTSKILFDNHNAETELQRRAMETDARNPRRWGAAAYSFVQMQRLARFERWACQESDAVTVVSKDDRVALFGLLDDIRGTEFGERISVVPNCIDTEQYAHYTGELIPFDIVFMGKMDYRPNIDAALYFCDEIWPFIRSKHPNATFAVVGQKPHARLDRLRNVAGVTITGWVDSVQPYLQGCRVFVMPLRMGGGTRLKLIEAMAAGKPIVSTTIGAAGFPIVDGRELLIGDSADAFAGAVNAILSGQHHQHLERLSAEFAKDYDWRTVVPRLFKVYERLGIAA